MSDRAEKSVDRWRRTQSQEASQQLVHPSVHPSGQEGGCERERGRVSGVGFVPPEDEPRAPFIFGKQSIFVGGERHLTDGQSLKSHLPSVMLLPKELMVVQIQSSFFFLSFSDIWS